MGIRVIKNWKCFFGLAVGLLLMVSSVEANPPWYVAKIIQITPNTTTGDVYVQIRPGSTESNFAGAAWGILPNSEAGTNRMLAVMLSAMAMNSEISVKMANTPSPTPQVITGSGLLAP